MLRELERAGCISSTHPEEAEGSPSDDTQILRIAKVLHEAGVAANKIAAAAPQLRSLLLQEIDPELERTATSEIRRLPTILDIRPSNASIVKRKQSAEQRRQQADQHYEAALALEETDLDAARDTYLAALAAHADHLEARINLGRLLHLQGDLLQAEKIYRAARHVSAELSFNLAVLLEDLNREAEAVLAYRQALALDPGFEDAHYNLSRLHERANRPQDALRHLLAYRRQTQTEDT